MNTLSLTRPSLADLLLVCRDLEADQIAEYEAITGPYNPETVAMQLHGSDIAHVFRDETGKPYCAGGYVLVNDTTAESWMISTPARAGHHVEITRVSLQVMAQLFAAGITRLQTRVTADRVLARKWYRTLGLKKEATLEKYGRGDQTLMIYARTA